MLTAMRFRRSARRITRARGFSLIEAMTAVTMLAILAALAVPNLSPEVKKAQLEGATESIAAFVTAARTDAITSRRCVRVRLSTTQRPHRLIAEALNAWDCDGATGLDNDTQTPENAPRIVGTGSGQTNLWLQLRDLPLPAAAMDVSFGAPDGTGLAIDNAAGGGGVRELRWRPTGRLYSRDRIVSNDDVAIRVDHKGLTNTDSSKFVVVESQGLVCALPRGALPTRVSTASPNNLVCP